MTPPTDRITFNDGLGNTLAYDAWMPDQVFPDYFFCGIPHINYYEATTDFTDIKLYVADLDEDTDWVTRATINEDTGKAVYRLVNDTMDPVKYTCILAAYDNTGKLVSAVSDTVTVVAKATFEKVFLCPKDYAVVKAFIWDENYIPLIKQAEAFGMK
jgi:hypothetical protein